MASQQKSTSKSKTSAMDMWLNGITPVMEFEPANEPAQPDYVNASHWAARPDTLGSAAFAPEGMEVIDPSAAKADVFFVHPTTYVGTANWNENVSAPMDTTRAGEIVAELIMPGQAGLFNGCCRMYAPRYRQATLAAFFKPGESGRSALDLAYGDVVRAFRHYLEHDNKGRPFFLAGHSQGACHLMRLLAEDFDVDLKPQLIAVYLLGFKVTAQAAASFAHISTPAKNGTEAASFIAFDSYLDGTDALAQSDQAEHRFASGWVPRGGKHVHSVNPVNWSVSASSGKDEHLGYGVVTVNNPALLAGLYMPGPDGALGLKATGLAGPVTPGVATYIDESGFLKIGLPEHDFMNMGIFGGNYHNRDVALFYMNLRINAEARVAAFMQS